MTARSGRPRRGRHQPDQGWPRCDADEQKRSALRHDPRDRAGRQSCAVGICGAAGVFRIARPELDTWIAHPTRRIETMLWDAADGGSSSARTQQLWSLRLQVGRWQAVVCGSEGIQVARPASPFVQYAPTAGLCRASDRGSRNSIAATARRHRGADFDCRRASATCRSTTRHSASSRRKRSVSSTAWTGRTRLERGRQRAPRAVFEPASTHVPLSRHRCEQQRCVE